jgi:hypothetical protein
MTVKRFITLDPGKTLQVCILFVIQDTVYQGVQPSMG